MSHHPDIDLLHLSPIHITNWW